MLARTGLHHLYVRTLRLLSLKTDSIDRHFASVYGRYKDAAMLLPEGVIARRLRGLACKGAEC